MPSSGSNDEESTPDSPDNHAIIDKIYAIACDPKLYEDLIDAWAQKLSEDSSDELKSAGILHAHAARATALMERLSPIDARNDMERLVGDLQRPALACLESGRVLYANKALTAQAQARSPHAITDLGLSERSVMALSGHLRAGEGNRHVLLQLETTDGRSISASLSHAGTDGDDTVFLVVFYDFIWNPMLESVLAEAFGLTASERAVVEGFAAGLSTAQIARQRGRSEETVRTQLKAIMAKTGTRSQLELLRLLFGFTALAEHSAGTAGQPVALRRHAAGASDFMTRGRRRYTVHISGAPSRHLCLHLHSSMGFYLLSERARQAAAERELQLWSVVKPGYGASGPLPARSEYCAAVAADLLELIERSEADRVSLLVEGVSFRLGADLACRLGERCRGLNAVSPLFRLSAVNPEKHDQKWHRILLQTAARSPALLPFFVRAGFAYARAIGPSKFLEEIYGRSPVDLQALKDTSIVALLKAADRIALADGRHAHEAFTDGLLLAVEDWTDRLSGVACPITLYYGRGDRTFTRSHVERLRAIKPAIRDVEFEDAGHLAILTHGHRIVADIAASGRP